MLSVSALAGYLYCQRKIYLQYVLRFFEPIKPATIKGTIRHQVHEAINNKEEEIVTSITKKLSKEELFNLYRNTHADILKETITKYKDQLEKLNLSPEEILKKVWPLIMEESITRAKNIWEFMQTHLVYGKDLWEKLTPKIKTEYRITSEKLGIRGIIDQIEVYEKGVVPVELKTGSCPKEGVWPNHKIQLAAYALLLEEGFSTNVKEGFITYLDVKQRRHVPINPFLRQELLDLITKVKNLLNNKDLPDFEKNQNKCNKCGIKDICHSPKTIEKRVKEIVE